MSKTYSKKQKWIEFNVSIGIGRPVFGNPNYRGNFERPQLVDVEEKLCRHPNKKTNKGLRRETYMASRPGNILAKFRNPCGDICERSSRLRLLKSTGNGKRRAIIKNETLKLINDLY